MIDISTHLCVPAFDGEAGIISDSDEDIFLRRSDMGPLSEVGGAVGGAITSLIPAVADIKTLSSAFLNEHTNFTFTLFL